MIRRTYTTVTAAKVVNDQLIVLEFDNGIAMHLEDSSDQYDRMQISFHGDPAAWII